MQIDELTQLKNRKYLEFKLNESLKEANEFNEFFGLLFFDIDYFKKINDTYGHTIGDELLKVISSTIKNNLRPLDIIDRWGGEEFIAIIKVNSLVELKNMAERIRKLCVNSSYRYKNKSIKATISIGGTLYKKNETINELIHRADQLMYEAKHTGRNKSIIK